MNREAIESLLLEGESEHLEWKEDFADGLIQQKVIQGKGNPNWDRAKAELLKDLIALANSAGRAPAYLVYGVEDLGRMRKVEGISKSFDGADFQQWAKNTFDPRPTFQYTEIPWTLSKTIGVFQIEKTPNYPHVVKVDIGGILHKGQVWFRTGSQNDIALRSDLEKMFLAGKPVQFLALHDPNLAQIKKIYRDQGREIEFPLLQEKENLINQGYEVATYPGTRQEIVVGRDRPELILLIKPKRIE